MKRIVLVLCLLSLPVLASAQETINLTTPIARANITNYTPRMLHIQLSPFPQIIVVIVDTAGTEMSFSYPCDSPCVNSTPASVTALITALNTANLTTRSLWRRVFDRLVLDFPARFAGGATVP